MIFQFLVPISLAVCIVFAWGAYTLPFSSKGKCFFFALNVFGLAYIIPIGPFLDPARYLPYPLVLGLALLSAFAFFYFWIKIMQIGIAIILFIILIWYKKIKSIRNAAFTSCKVNILLISLCLITAPYSVYETTKVPRVKHVTLKYETLPNELENYTIALLTDTHTGLIFQEKWQENVVRKIMETKPQLIVHTGDIGDVKPQDIKKHLAPLKNFSAPDGVYYVFGNHENYHTLAYWQNFFKENNLNVLENETIQIHEYLSLTGASPRLRNFPADTAELLKIIPNQGFKIFLDHYPASFRKTAPHIDLQLSGHTHGGTVFFLAPVVKKFNAGFVSGIYEQNKAKLYVSSGTGIWTYTAFRLFVPSEITLIHLTGNDNRGHENR